MFELIAKLLVSLLILIQADAAPTPAPTATYIPTIPVTRIPTRVPVITATIPVPYPTPVSVGMIPHLRRIAGCESAGNPLAEPVYTIVSSNGMYYGAYQFDLATWQSVGGTGYPHQASPAEQDLRAQILYSRRGSAPWPVCQYR